MPRPPCERASALSTWPNISKMRGSWRSSMPMPLSCTVIATSSPSTAAARPDPPAGRGVLRGVDQQVRDDLREPRQVAFEGDRLRRQIDRQRMARRIDDRLRDLDRTLDDGRELQRLAPQMELAARHARDVEQVVEQVRHLRDLPIDDVAAPDHLRVALGGAAQHLDRIADRRERVAQLVRERRDEVVLLAIGLAQRLLGVLALGDVHRDAEAAHRLAGGVVLDLAAVADPGRAAVGLQDAELEGERLVLRDRLGAALHEHRPVVRMHQLGTPSRVGVNVSGLSPNTA